MRRLTALLAAVLVATHSLALERCRTACVETVPTSAATSTHACHDLDNDSGPSVLPTPRACGHTDDAGSPGVAGVVPSKISSELVSSAAVVVTFAPAPQRAETASVPEAERRPTRNTLCTPLRL